MATPLTPDQMLAALRKWGVRFNEISGWRTRGRNYVGHGAWGPVIGCIVHHTGDDAPDDADLRVVRDGRSDLPGPLAQFGARDDGSIDLIASGRSNHAGTGDPGVYAAVKAQSYGDYPPATHFHEGSTGGTDGNTCFYGCETYYSGVDAPTQVQYRAVVLLYAAICDAHGWSAKAVIGHKEWSNYKSDPAKVDMRDMRADVGRALAMGPAAAAAWAYGTTNPDPEVTMPVIVSSPNAGTVVIDGPNILPVPTAAAALALVKAYGPIKSLTDAEWTLVEGLRGRWLTPASGLSADALAAAVKAAVGEAIAAAVVKVDVSVAGTQG